MTRGGARPGAGRKAKDRPDVPLRSSPFTVRLTDLGALKRLGAGTLRLGLRRLIDLARAHQRPDVLPTAQLSSDSTTPPTPSVINQGQAVARDG